MTNLELENLLFFLDLSTITSISPPPSLLIEKILSELILI
nr:MAG TPA: hypothetical protein [Herelleviridae sp.]DAP49089.1 MAG TPA: hypothetical protein [Caudoviricetes sp.]DAV76527.1 MAG TPA: hypothetical protein [Caudoviricetes sp.]